MTSPSAFMSKYDYWVEYSAISGGMRSTIQSSRLNDANGLPFDRWLTAILMLIREQHPEAINFRLYRIRMQTPPKPEFVGTLPLPKEK